MKSSFCWIITLAAWASLCFADMSRISDDDMSAVTGQSGVYLTGEISINTNGGPVTSGYFGTCGSPRLCGARLSFQTQQDGGWFTLDNIRGSIAFEGLTMQVRNISSGFGGDGLLFNRDVMEIGLPESLRMNDFRFTVATSNNIRPGDTGFKQIDLMTVEMNGPVTLEGNLLIFPTP